MRSFRNSNLAQGDHEPVREVAQASSPASSTGVTPGIRASSGTLPQLAAGTDGATRFAVSQQNSAAMAAAVAQLCPNCAMCCNGVLFKDVELQPGDSAAKLKALGLPVSNSRVQKFPQPCAALAGCRCQIYGDRPTRCRQFECALLKAVAGGQTGVSAALRTIGETQQRAEKVRRLLRAAGDVNESLALSLRFKRTQRRLESSALSAAVADTFGELTLAVHDLNLRLREKFYPAPGD